MIGTNSERGASGRLTVFTSIRPPNLGKIYSLGASGLTKRTAGAMVAGTFATGTFANVDDLSTLLLGIDTDQAISASLCTAGRLSGNVVAKNALQPKGDSIARTRDNFSFPEGSAGIVILDYDPPAQSVAMSPSELWKLLLAVCPPLGSGSALWWCSGSSFIFSGETEFQGLRGQRIYLLIKDLSDTVRFGEVLGKRLWLAGLGQIAVSKSGHRLIKTVFDLSMFQPARLDFIGGAVCEPPLVQRRDAPLILSRGGWIDTRKALPSLTPEEEARYVGLIDEAKAKAEPEAMAARHAWAASRIGGAVKKLVSAGMPVEHAEERASRMLSSALAGILLGDFELTLEDGKRVTVGEVLDKRDRYHNIQTLEPLEPDYQSGKVVGKLFLYGATPTLHSFAHGGQTYRLRRQPARLYAQKGRKSELASEIVKLLSDEPDVFSHGGVLVQVAEGRLRRLHKPALLHLIGNRIALYSKSDKGIDFPIDLPADVADMVLALAEL
jgi:hypothetical protein